MVSAQEIKQDTKDLAKKIFPSKSVIQDRRVQWSKMGGQAGAKALDKMAEKAQTAGFKLQSKNNTCSQSGVVYNSVKYVHDAGFSLELIYRYGQTASQNMFAAHLEYQA